MRDSGFKGIFNVVWTLFTLSLLLLPMGLSAQSEIRFEEVSSSNALSHNNVTCIHQDQLGFLWLGTFNGLNKYDGYSFKIYKFNDPEGNHRSINRIISIKEDRHGMLWVETYDGHYQRFDPATEEFVTFPGIEDEKEPSRCTDFFETEDGLVCLSTDKSGAIFIQTGEGRNNPVIKQLFHETGNSAGLSSNQVNFIFSDPENYLWIGTSKGLNRIHRDSLFQDVPPVHAYLPGCSFSARAIHGGKLWFGDQKEGLVCYDPSTAKLTRCSEEVNPGGPALGRITTLHASGSNLWIGTADGILGRYNSESGSFEEYRITTPETGSFIKDMYCDRYNQVWIVSNKFGITRFDPSSLHFTYYRLTPEGFENLTDDERLVLYEVSGNQFWVGGQNMGIQLYDRQEDRFIVYTNEPGNPHSLPSSIVECILEDRERTLWIGTSWWGMGLSKMITLDHAFRYMLPVDAPKAKFQNVVRSVYVDSKGYSWAGTKSGQIYIYDPGLEEIHVIKEDPRINYSGYNVYSISEDSQGRMWLCTKGAGIFYSNESVSEVSPHYERLTFSSIQHQPGNPNSLNNSNIYDLIIDDLGRIWVATYGGGLNMIEFDKTGQMIFHHFTTENSALTTNKLRDLHLDRNGRLWLATTLGINYIDIYNQQQEGLDIKHRLASASGSGGLSYNDIIMVTEDKKGQLWLATAGGGVNIIHHTDGGDFDIDYLSVKDGLKDDYILSITEDIYGFMWIGTLTGLSSYNPMNGEIENFDKKNGLPEVTFSERTSTLSPNGRVLFGTVNGFYAVTPDQISIEEIQPGICLTGLMLNNEEVTPGIEGSPIDRSISYLKEITLTHDQSDFSISFSMLSFKSPENNHYAYMLEGFNDGWNYVGTENKATFTNVPYGNYTFRVKGLNSDHSEYGTETSLRVTILPPIWLTGWAFAIYAVLILGLLYLTYRIALRFFRLKNNLKVEKRVAESKLRFFTNISHEIRTPLTLILGPMDNLISRTDVSSDVRRQLAVVHRNSKRLLRMVNQLLDFRKVQNEKVSIRIQEIEVIPFLHQIYESFESQARQKNIAFNLVYENSDEHLTLWGDIQKLDIVIFNLLSNAFKFTPENGRISLVVSRENEPENVVVIQVIDTGIGIAKEKLDLIFNRFFVSHTGEKEKYQGTGIGLSLSQEYMKLHNGEITVESEEGKGTIFSLKLRSGNSHFPEDVIIKQREAYSYTPKVHDMEESLAIGDQDFPDQPSMDPDKASILIVEDDVEMCHYLQQILEPAYRVEIAKDGREGWEKAHHHAPDLIVTDVMMPRMNGIELTAKLKEEFNTCHIPVIMLSSKSAVESQVEGLQVGAEAYVPKPFDAKLLLSYIQSFLAQRRKIKEILESRVELKPDEVQVSPRDKEFIERVLQLIEQNLGDPGFNVEKLAGEMYISRTLFYKKIKGITGYQPVELIRIMRLKKAANYFETGEFTVSEVAYKVGYNDIRYFSTCFKKQFGTSPSQYQPG